MKWILIMLFFIPSPKGWNQSVWNLQATTKVGWIIPEYKHLQLYLNKPISGFDISCAKRTTGKNYWERIYNFPSYGFTLSWHSLGNPDVYGQAFGLFPWFESNFVDQQKFRLSGRFGLGAGYTTRKFDLNSNYAHISIGSYWNLHFEAKLLAQYELSQKWYIHGGLGFMHFSNANMAEPNLGMNAATILLGVAYQPKASVLNREVEIPEHKRLHELDVVLGLGGKHTRALQANVYFTSSISAEYHHHTFRKLHFGGGVDLFFNGAFREELNDVQAPVQDAFSSGFHLSQELVYDKFSFILQEGFFLGLKDKAKEGFMYNRAIVRYKIDGRWVVHFSMKSHLHILDYPEIGLGYAFLSSKL